MQIDLVAIGRVKEPYLREGISEYLKRLSGLCTIRVFEFPEERLKESASVSEIILACEQEGRNLLRVAGQAGLLVGLDSVGEEMTSEILATRFKKWGIDGPHHIAIVIGGPHGLSDEVRGRSDLLLPLSLMTFPHQMVRLILLEQIYRAYSINRGLPYHR
jgi:23S rRNA (pseudouridine1915-N3)-methyltransferase